MLCRCGACGRVVNCVVRRYTRLVYCVVRFCCLLFAVLCDVSVYCIAYALR